jgi:hypothetical protein
MIETPEIGNFMYKPGITGPWEPIKNEDKQKVKIFILGYF